MNKKAFTLLELLVVIVILGIVMALLFPAMGRVREGARRVLCMNNLRQHGIAWYLYLDDHNEKFPLYNIPPQEGGTNIETFGGKKGSRYDLDYGANYRVLNRYLDIYDESSPNLEVFHCPGDRKPTWCTAGEQRYFDYRGTSYIANDRIFKFGPSKQRPLSTITRSHSKVYLESCTPHSNPGHGGDIPVWGKITKHFLMVLFVDGHVAGPFLYRSDFETKNNIPDSGKKVLLDPNGTTSQWD